MKLEHSRELVRRDTEYWWFLSRYRMVRRLLAGVRPLPLEGGLLDFGCGAGGFLKFAEGAGICTRDRMIGLDAEPSSVECLRAAGFQGMVAEAETLSRIQLPDAPSVITMLDVLEHLEHPVEALRELRRIGRPGAVLVCLVPAMPFLWSEWDERLGHQRRYGAGLLRQHLGEAGWNAISVQHLFPSMVIPAVARKWMGVSSGADEFPEVSDRVNRLLVHVNDLEHRFARWPFGTSLAALAIS